MVAENEVWLLARRLNRVRGQYVGDREDIDSRRELGILGFWYSCMGYVFAVTLSLAGGILIGRSGSKLENVMYEDRNGDRIADQVLIDNAKVETVLYGSESPGGTRFHISKQK